MVAATTAGLYPDLVEACHGMQQGGQARPPNPAARQRFDIDYSIFLAMHEQRSALDALMRA